MQITKKASWHLDDHQEFNCQNSWGPRFVWAHQSP